MKVTLQQFADDVVAEEYRQSLKTAEEACEALGWTFDDRPDCCGVPVETRGFLGAAYHAECKECGKFMHDMSGPSFSESGSSVSFLDGETVEIDVDARWICGTKPKP